MGRVPLWYRVIQASRYLGVAPWDLEQVPLYWLERAEAAQAAEAHGERERAKRAKG